MISNTFLYNELNLNDETMTNRTKTAIEYWVKIHAQQNNYPLSFIDKLFGVT